MHENELDYQNQIERLTEERDHLSNLNREKEQQLTSKSVQIDVGIQTTNDLDS